MVNKQIIFAVVIHVVLGFIFLSDPEYSIIGYLAGLIVLLNLIGILLIKSGKTMLGAKIFLVSSAVMVPIGMIGALGARKIIDEEKRKEFYNNK